MTRILFILCLSLVLGNNQYVIAQASIDDAKISFLFVSKDVKGTIAGFESNSKIDFENPENSFFEGSVAVKTLDTNNGLRNWHLKGKYFKEDDFPKIRFKSNAVSEKEGGYIVNGNLTLKGTTKPVIIKIVRKGNQLKGTSSIYTSDFGINIKKERKDNLVEITLLFDIDEG